MNLFTLTATKPLAVNKEGKVSDNYAVSADAGDLHIHADLDTSAFNLNGLLNSMFATYAYQYWTKNDPEMADTDHVEGEGEDATTFRTFADMQAFYAFLNLKASGGAITSAMKEKAAASVGKAMKARGVPAATIKRATKLIETATPKSIHEVYDRKPNWFDGIVKQLGVCKELTIQSYWLEAKNYKAPDLDDDDSLDAAFDL